MKKALKIIIPVILVLGVAGYFFYRYKSQQTIFNDTYVNGNLGGNLYNDGLFCEHGDYIYFSNPNDGYTLYSMTKDGKDVKKLADDIASFINADDNYVYYVRNNLGGDGGGDFSFLRFNTNSLCRLKLKNKEITILDPDPSLYASLIENYIYYIHYDEEHGSTFNRVKIDGTEKETLNKNPYYTCSTNGQYLYYNGLEKDHNIYQLDTANGSSKMLYQGNCWMPVMYNNEIFFMDCDNNYALCSLRMGETQPFVLVDQRIEMFNVYGNYIYFQTNDLNGNAALCRVNINGSDMRVIRNGNHRNIHITSDTVYFREFGDDKTIYQMPADGTGSISVFNPIS